MNTEKLIREIKTCLDYTADYDERISIVKGIDEKYGEKINTAYTEYAVNNQHSFTSHKKLEQITSLLDLLSDYVLFAEKKENKEKNDYPFKSDGDLKDGKAENFLDINYFANVLKKINYDEKNIYTTKTKTKLFTVEYVLKNMKDCSYINDYIDYNDKVIDIIKTLDKQYDKQIESGVQQNDVSNLIWKNEKTNNVYIFDGRQLAVLKKSVGYTKSNCIELSRDIIEVYSQYYKPISCSKTPQTFEISRKLSLDFKNKEEIRGLLINSCLVGWNDKFDWYVRKMDRLVRKSNLTEREKEVYDILRFGNGKEYSLKNFKKRKLSQAEIASKIKVSQQAVLKTIDRITNKIHQQYMYEYEDYLYTFLEKGEYQTCKKCGNNKILSERNFRFRPIREAFDGVCLECQEKQTYL